MKKEEVVSSLVTLLDVNASPCSEEELVRHPEVFLRPEPGHGLESRRELEQFESCTEPVWVSFSFPKVSY